MAITITPKPIKRIELDIQAGGSRGACALDVLTTLDVTGTQVQALIAAAEADSEGRTCSVRVIQEYMVAGNKAASTTGKYSAAKYNKARLSFRNSMDCKDGSVVYLPAPLEADFSGQLEVLYRSPADSATNAAFVAAIVAILADAKAEDATTAAGPFVYESGQRVAEALPSVAGIG